MAFGVLQLRKSLPHLWLSVAWVVLTFIAWSRLPETTRQTAWAEDGGVFLRDVLSSNGWETLIKPYDGYMHLIPRALVGVVYAIAPIDAFAVWVSCLSCAVAAGVGLGVFMLAKPLIQSPWLRAIFAAIPVLLPVAPIEVLGNAANLHWYFLWLSPWLLINRPDSRGGRTGLFLIALTTSASEVITVIFLPLAAWMIWKRKNYWAPIGLIMGVGLQLLTTILSPRTESLRVDNSVGLRSVAIGFFVQPIASLVWTDSHAFAAGLAKTGAPTIFLPATLLTLLCLAIFMFGTTTFKVAALCAVGSAVTCWTASVLINANPVFNYAYFDSQDWRQNFEFSRYAVAPGMILLALIPLALASLLKPLTHGRQPGTKISSSTALLAFVLVMLPNFFQASTLRQAGPEWAAQVATARASCSSDKTLTESTVSVAPVQWKFSLVELPCALLDPDRSRHSAASVLLFPLGLLPKSAWLGASISNRRKDADCRKRT